MDGNDEIDVDDVRGRYTNIGAKRSASSKKNEKSGLNHFICFLREEQVINDDADYTELEEESITQELIGKFGGYLYEKMESRDGALQYLSKVKTYLCSTFAGVSNLLERNKWYTKLRANMKKEFLSRCLEAGTPVKRKQASMSDTDHKYIVAKLLYTNTIESTEQRSFMNCLWVLLGRVEEVASLRTQDLGWDNSSKMDCMLIDINRFKTGEEQECRVFVHRSDWYRCPLHAIACQFALVSTTETSDSLFSRIVENQASKYLNKLLAYLYESWENDDEEEEEHVDFRRFTSHSVRRGSTNHLATNPLVALAAVYIRGGWALGQIASIFHYIMGTPMSDGVSGRALSGWDDNPNSGGKCPGKLSV